MPLFESRRPSKEVDLSLAKKVAKKAPSKGLNPLEEITQRVQAALGKYEKNYEYVMDKQKLISIIDICLSDGICSIDTENSGLNVFRVDMAGFSIYSPSMEKAYYIPLGHRSIYTKEIYGGQLPMDFCKQQLSRLVDFETKLIFHNAKYDTKIFRRFMDIYFVPYWDTMIASFLINEAEEHGLKYQYHKYIEQSSDEEFFKFGDLFDDMNFCEIPITTGFIYAARDPEITYKLYEYQKNVFETNKSLKEIYDLFLQIEMPLITVVADMEMRGVLIDQEYAGGLSRTYGGYHAEAKKAFYEELDKYSDKIRAYNIKNPGKLSNPINYASPQQLAIVLYDILHLTSPDKQKPRGTGEEILKKLGNIKGFELGKKLLALRGYEKLMGTYIEALPETCEKDGAIHASFNQCGAETGRFSCSEPNLQNIPSHDKFIRKMFISRPGYYLVGSDYSQQEPRILAFLSRDENMLDAYRHKKDIYAQVTSLIYHLPYEACLEKNPDGTINKTGKEMRGKVKAIVLGIMYGRGSASIAEELEITKQEAAQIQESFFNAFPAVKEFVARVQADARKKGYVQTLWGRRRHLPDMQLDPYEISAMEGYVENFDPLSFDNQSTSELGESTKRQWIRKLENCWDWKKRDAYISEAMQQGILIKENGAKIADAERQCVNSVIQGSAADMTKLAMVKIGYDEEMNKLGFHTLMQVHDELIGECPIENAKRVAERLEELMIDAAMEKLDIPMKCDASITDKWTGEEIEL